MTNRASKQTVSISVTHKTKADKRKPHGGTQFVPFPAVRVLSLCALYLFFPSRVIQFFALFIIAVLCASWAYGRHLARTVTVTRSDTLMRGFKNSWLAVELTVENKSALPAFLLSVNDAPGRFTPDGENRRLFTLNGRSRITFSYHIRSGERGIFPVGPATVRGSDPLGLYPFSFQSGQTSQVIIYPASSFADAESPAGMPLGTLLSKNRLYEDTTRCRSIRDYTPGDDPRRINWKVSARSGTLAVNEYDPSFSWPFTVFLNLHPHEYTLKLRSELLERAIEAAAALCVMAAQAKQETGIIICTPKLSTPYIINPAADTLGTILEQLARVETGDTDAESEERRAAAFLRTSTGALPFGSRLFYVGPELEAGEYAAFAELRGRNVTCEFAILSERRVPDKVCGFMNQYQITGEGYELFR